MKKIVIHAGFHPEQPRTYQGEHIYKVVRVRQVANGHDFHTGAAINGSGVFYELDNGAWVRDLGNEKYQTDWTGEERWGRVEEIETDEAGNTVSARDLGFMILRVDRARGLL